MRRALHTFVRAEFQGPIAALAELIDLLAEDAARQARAEYADDIGRMRAAAERLDGIVTAFLDGNWAATDSEFEQSVSRSLRHDLRTPVTSVIGYGELLAEEIRDTGPPELLHPLADVLDASGRLLSDIERLVEYARSTEGNGPAQAGQDDEPAIMRQAVNAVRRLVVVRNQTTPTVSGRILVVDDSASILDLVVRRLEREGHVVTPASTGMAALELARREAFDVVLVDLLMPDMSGLEVLQRLRKRENGADLPVIVMSALDDEEAISRCIEAGAEDYLSKPLNPSLLRARISASLDRKFLRDGERAAAAELRAAEARSDTLLRNVLPNRVVERLRAGETVTADTYPDATILFADLVGFTSLTSRLRPGETLALLNEIFSGFDALAAEGGIEKIKTIGDGYMAAGNVPEPLPDHAVAVTRMALGMHPVVEQASKARGFPLALRIGIATGPAIAGIIGTHKFFYDVWGDTVNTASRLEQHCEPGRIHLSAPTCRALGDAFPCEPRPPLDIRGKGMMETFYVTTSSTI